MHTRDCRPSSRLHLNSLLGVLLWMAAATAVAQPTSAPITPPPSPLPPSTRAHSDSLLALTRPSLRSWVTVQAALARDTAVDVARVASALDTALVERLGHARAGDAEITAVRLLVLVEAMKGSMPVFDSLVGSFRKHVELMTQVSFAKDELHAAADARAASDTSEACDTSVSVRLAQRLAEVTAAGERADARLASRAGALATAVTSVADLRRQVAVVDSLYDVVFDATKMLRRAWKRVSERETRLLEMIARVEATAARLPRPRLAAIE